MLFHREAAFQESNLSVQLIVQSVLSSCLLMFYGPKHAMESSLGSTWEETMQDMDPGSVIHWGPSLTNKPQALTCVLSIGLDASHMLFIKPV